MSETSLSGGGQLPRRAFLQYAGAGASLAALALAGCSDEEEQPIVPAVTTVDVGGTDVGALNFVYALKQVELAFYTALRTGTYYTGLAPDSAEKQILDDLQKHESVHGTFFRSLLTVGSAIRLLETDFSNVDLNTRLSAPGAAHPGVLNVAMALEDLGVAACNGSARFITNAQTLLTLGKIVSVEAHHAAMVRDLVSYNSFVDNDVVEVFTPGTSGTPGDGTGTGLERAKSFTDILAVINPYLKEGSKLTATQLV